MTDPRISRRADDRRKSLAAVLACGMAAVPVLALWWACNGHAILRAPAGAPCWLGDGWQWWSGSYLALHGQVDMVFTPAAFSSWVNGRTGCGLHVWSYPPTTLLLLLPVGLLPPVPAVLLFDALGTALFGWSIRRAGLKGDMWLTVMLSPAAIFNLASQQNGAWTGGLFLTGLALAERRPILGGIAFGMLTAKPQLCVLVPFFLLGRRNIRCLAAMAATALALALAGTLAFSVHAWGLFVTQVMPEIHRLIEQALPPGNNATVVTAYALARATRMGAAAANACQLGASLLAAAGAVWVARRPGMADAERWAFLSLLAVLATPYLQGYDLLSVGFACVVLLRGRTGKGVDTMLALMLCALWAMPGMMPWLGIFGVPPLVPVLVMAILLVAGWKLTRPAAPVPAA
jgi:hypothetical protein